MTSRGRSNNCTANDVSLTDLTVVNGSKVAPARATPRRVARRRGRPLRFDRGADVRSKLSIRPPGIHAVAAVVLSPTGMSANPRATRVGESFVANALRGRRVGDALLRAFNETGSDPATVELLKIYNLLGDPALRVPENARRDPTH